MSVTFDVARVALGNTRLETIPVAEAIHRLLTGAQFGWQQTQSAPVEPFEAVCPVEGGVCGVGLHPLVAAAHMAFDRHLPLELSPDHIWITLAQGFAQHVRCHESELRSRIVEHRGRETIEIRRDDFVPGAADNPWPEVFDAFATALREYIGPLHELVVADFSTTGPLERAVSQLVLMHTVEKYFEYALTTICGIPRITLTGTAEDWRSLRARVQGFREFGLQHWIEALEPILDEFVHAAAGRVNSRHWRSLFKLNEASGGPYVTGWLQALFPYVVDRPAGTHRPNPYVQRWRKGMKAKFGGGPTIGAFPRGLSTVDFIWQFLEEKLAMSFLGGFVGVRQDPVSLSVRPHLGWAVRRC